MFGSDSRNVSNPPKLPELGLIERIGFGAYGEVWLAYNLATGARRAVKIVSRAAFSDERPFKREFEGIVKFDTVSRTHPSQLSLFQIGKNDEEGYFYYAMELADSVSDDGPYRARTLRADLENGRLPASRALDLATALAEALAHLHSNGLIHRDVKPSNIIYVNGRPKLADIGLVTDGSGERTILGTEGYLAPDCAGTAKADIYALGKVLYEAVTGMDRREFPKLPQDLRTWTDAQSVLEFNEIILRACASDPKHRYATADALLADLKLLEKGKSIRHQRSRERFLAGSIRVAQVIFAICLIAGLFHFAQQNYPSKDYSRTRALGPASTNIDANILCERGLNYVHNDQYDDFPRASSNFWRAIKLDPNFARPYACMLELLIRERNPIMLTELDELRHIRDKLVELAPDLASTYCAKSIFNFFYFHFPEAERDALESIRRDPDYELAHTAYAFNLLCWGRTAESRDQLLISQNITPAKSTIYFLLGHTYYVDRDFTNAIRFYEKTLETETSPHHDAAMHFMACAYRALGNFEMALAEYEAKDALLHQDTPDVRVYRLALRDAVKRDGRTGYWQEEWKFAQNYAHKKFNWQGVVQMNLGNTNAALDLLEKSYRTHNRDEDIEMVSLLFDECWDAVREHPRFKALLQEVGFTKVMHPNSQRKPMRWTLFALLSVGFCGGVPFFIRWLHPRAK